MTTKYGTDAVPTLRRHSASDATAAGNYSGLRCWTAGCDEVFQCVRRVRARAMDRALVALHIALPPRQPTAPSSASPANRPLLSTTAPMARARRFLVHLVIRRRWLVIALSIGAASVLTPRAGTAQQLERLTIGVRRSASANAVPLVLQDAPRATPTRHVVTGAIIGGLVGVVVRRSTADCDAEALSGLCRDSATLGGLTIGAATGAVIGLVIWVARNPRPTTAP